MKVKLLLAAAVLALVVIYRILFPPLSDRPYLISESPDGTHRIEVFPFKTWISNPGGASGRPGVVYLKDESGKILHRVRVPLVQVVESPVWSKNRVEIKLVADWDF